MGLSGLSSGSVPPQVQAANAAAGLTYVVVLPLGAYIADGAGAAENLGAAAGPEAGVLTVGEVEPDTTITVTLQQSANGSTGWANIAGAAFPAVTESESQTVLALSYVRTQPYLRAAYTVAGEGSAGTVGVAVGIP